ncbi:MAG TPA: protein translocase subunit SecF [Bacillota bacterium]|nr:protein translocase subunit SecF [Bacillota bacterium]
MNKKPSFFIIAIMAIIMAFIAINGLSLPLWNALELNVPGAPDMRFGIDIRGGVDAVFEPADDSIEPTTQQLDAARTIIETRLDNQNILDREVTIDRQTGSIIVRFPWKADETEFDPESAIAELGETAMLTFQDEDGNILVEGSHVVESFVSRDERSGFVVSLVFDEEGTELFSEATERLIKKPIIIYMDETLIQSATVSVHIKNGEAIITGMGGMEDAKELSDKINAGSLPFSLITRNHSTISPRLGSDSLDVMVLAAVIAFIVICILLIVYYRLMGVIGCFALLIQVSGQVLALSIPQITLTLTGIAGIILTIGMGVDANIIISERISEEIKSGKSVGYAIKSGYKNAFSSVLDSNLTLAIVAIILLIFGSGSLLSFGYTLLTGVVFNLLAGVGLTRLMVTSLFQFKPLRKPVFYQCLSKKIGEDDGRNFYGKKFIFIAITITVLLTGLTSSFFETSRPQLDIQFKGGAMLNYSYTGEIDEARAQDIANRLTGRIVNAQTTSDLATGEKRLVLNIAGNEGLEAGAKADLDDTLIEAFPDAGLEHAGARLVDPYFGKLFLRNGVMAILLAAISIVIYVWIRFKKVGGLSAGLFAVAALLIDLLVVFFVHVIFRIPIGETYVAVSLTIIGYSINDTIVAFDRIRENLRKYPRKPIEWVTNLSITQTFKRTINTTVAFSISVVMIYVLASANSIESIQNFALPMGVGALSGLYSSILLTGPFWSLWKNRKVKGHKKAI